MQRLHSPCPIHADRESPYVFILFRRLPWLFLGLLLLAGGCAGKQTADEGGLMPGHGFFQGKGTPLTETEILAHLRKADYILVGERHDSLVDHTMQAKVIELLATHGQQPLIGLEMLPRTTYDTVLANFTAGALPERDLPTALDWEKSWGFDFALYRPIFAVINRYNLRAFGVNIPHDLRHAVSRNGLAKLTADQRKGLPERIIPPRQEQKEQLHDLFLMHSAMRASGQDMGGKTEKKALAKTGEPRKTRSPALPVSLPAVEDRQPVSAMSSEPAFERFLLIQSLWDSVMAEQAMRLRAAFPGNPMVILAGGGHVAYGYGIAHRLRLLDPETRIFSIMPSDSPLPDPQAADAFFYSPENRRGYGLKLAQSRGKLTITSVQPGSIAAQAGLREGDVILSIQQQQATTPARMHRIAMAQAREGKDIALSIDRQGTHRTFLLKTTKPFSTIAR